MLSAPITLNRCGSAAIPTTSRFPISEAEGFENQLAELVARDLGTTVRVHAGGRNGADSCETR